jgi:hypothetical protein
MTEWKEIKGYSSYEVSNEGNIRNKETMQMVKPHKARNGYSLIKLYRDGKPFTRQVHRLVAMAFIGDVEGLEVNHKDGNKANNNVENLELVSRSENIKHAYANGLMKDHHPDVIPKKKVRCTTNETVFESIHEASRVLGIDRIEIRRVCNKKRNHARGFHFEWI